jgi:hypothetical protein
MSPAETSPLRRVYPVPGGPDVRLRLAGPADATAAAALLARRGVDADPLALRRLLAYDPARRTVLAALTPVDGSDTMVGFGAIDAGEDAPDVLVVDERLAAGLGEVLGRVLIERARRRRAA